MFLLFLLADYVAEAKEILFHITSSKIQKTTASFEAVVPAPMTSQFADRINKDEAIEKKVKCYLQKGGRFAFCRMRSTHRDKNKH